MMHVIDNISSCGVVTCLKMCQKANDEKLWRGSWERSGSTLALQGGDSS